MGVDAGLLQDATVAFAAVSSDRSLREAFHQLHLRVAAESSNSCRTLWSILRVLDGAQEHKLQRLTDIYGKHAGDALTDPILEAAKDEAAKDKLPTKVVDDSKIPRYCEPCKKWLNGKTQYEDHLRGESHRKTVEGPAQKPAKRRLPVVYQ